MIDLPYLPAVAFTCRRCGRICRWVLRRSTRMLAHWQLWEHTIVHPTRYRKLRSGRIVPIRCTSLLWAQLLAAPRPTKARK